MTSFVSRGLAALAQAASRALPDRWGRALVRQPVLVLVLPLVLAALAMRLNNAVRYPSVHGFDSYAHATYIWHMMLTGSVPMAADGWGRFHPPLYYAICAGIWSLLRALEPGTVLKLLNVLFGLVGLGSVLVAWDIARRFLDGPARAFAWAAALFVLYLPVHIYTAPMVGNEGLSTALCSLGLFLLVRLLQTERFQFAVLLGLALGAAMLTKFTAIVVVGSAMASIGLWGLVTRRVGTAIVRGAVVMACVLAVSGWFYARNVMEYGNPFQMSRDFFSTKRIEATIPVGQRGPSAYFSFDTSIFRHPLYFEGPVLDSVWAGVYATAWFDAHGNWFLPSAATDSTMHHVGRILMVLGLMPTFVTVLGIAAGVGSAIRRARDPVILPMLTTTACMLAMFVIYTHENRIFTAVKASYMLPAIVPFAFWFALGLKTLASWGALLRDAASAALLAFAGFVLPVYTYQLLFEVPLGAHYWNAIAVIECFAGFPELARPKFEAATIFDGISPESNLYLAHENLGTLALQQGDAVRALAEFREARSLMPAQVFGLPEHVEQFLREVDADYANSFAVIYDRLGWTDLALREALSATDLDPSLPEAYFDQGVLLMKRGDVVAAAGAFERAAAADPGFAEAQRLLAVTAARLGRCDQAGAALALLRGGDLPRRRYPHAVGTGELHDAAIVRRRRIEDGPGILDADVAAEVAACRAAPDGRVGGA